MSELHIEGVAAGGDGVAKRNGKPVFVPRTLPGETVRPDGPGTDGVEIVEASPQRVEPVCQHFDGCGNCTFQHWSMAGQLAWKREQVEQAFRKAGLSIAVDDVVASPLHSRRRVEFTARRDGPAIAFGFNGRGTHDIVTVSECPIATPAIVSALPALKALVPTLLRGGKTIQLAVTDCSNGLDLTFTTDDEPGEDMLAAFVRAFARSGFLRASVNGSVVAEREKPMVAFGGIDVAVPAGGFLQAVADAEDAMADLVVGHLLGRKKVADLFCGSGTFALRLARFCKVHGVELSGNAIDALNHATHADGLKPVTTETRDLDQLPLTAQELKPFDGLCLDPPRAGAEPQVAQIAKSGIRAVAYVSCNPVTLARDCAILTGGGYELERVQPIDQFVFSTHIEAVALLTKKQVKTKRSIFR